MAETADERRLLPSGGGEDWSAAAFMQSRPLAVTEDAQVLAVCERMAQGRIGQVIVVPVGWRAGHALEQPPEPSGIFTERDLIRAFAQYHEKVLTMSVGELMTHPVVCVAPNEDILDVADLMTLMRIRRVPVVKNGKTLGLLTRGRVMEAQSRRLAAMEHENAVLEDRVVHDPLTGLANRVLFGRVLERELAKAKERGGAVSVLALDVDYFKRVNDTHGHPTGDLVLRQLADVMRRTLRRADLPARIGGEEFGVVLTQGEGAPEAVAEKLRLAVEREAFGDAAEPLRITASLGCATARPDEDAGSLMKRADFALYDAKGKGRNRVVVAA